MMLPSSTPRLSPLIITLEPYRKLVAQGQWLYLKAIVREFLPVVLMGEEVKAFLFYKDKQERTVREANHPHS